MNCHNGEKYLKDAINSIIIQSYKNWELIFFDNASTDNSSNIVKNFKDKRIKYYYSKFVNLGVARKKAFSLCKGEYVAFLDSDDYWVKNKLNLQVNQLNKFINCGVSFSNSYFFKNKKKTLLYNAPPQDGYIFEDLLKKYFISFDTVIIKKFYLKKMSHVFDERFTIAHDLDLLIRLSMICDFKYIDKPLSFWRIHDQSFSKNRISIINKEKNYFLKKLKKIVKNKSNKKKLLILFKNNIIKSELEEYLISQNLKKFFSLILKNKIFNFRILILIILMLIPGGKYIYSKKKKSW